MSALLQHAADVGGERNVGEQLALKDLLAFVGARLDELLAGLAELDIAAFDLHEMQNLQGIRNGKEVIRLHVQFVGDDR